VRKTFFPRWDREGEWKVEYAPLFKKWFLKDIGGKLKRRGLEDEYNRILKFEAICPLFTRSILFFIIPKNNNALYALLIHEICHVNARGHGEKWVEKMNAAHSKALKDVSNDLARHIRIHLLKEELLLKEDLIKKAKARAKNFRVRKKRGKGAAVGRKSP
jgi:hypothetical protein